MLLLDSVILIDHFNGISKATRYIKKHHAHTLISLITRGEVLCGFDHTEQLQLARYFLDEFEHCELTKDDIDLAAQLRQEYKLKLPDAIQAASAINRDCKLVTRNSKDFPTKQFAFVEIPYTL